ncbi:hypothetical protein RRG08_043544 [Elysia crispata]|uniref:LIM zinc-binding domain-containing protein n=1 Tax=Elysia crispata TaxID=231223 RepID=A0AAE0YFC9_9GAST|nr:hypothetical protein RRG08_043544 [Elysia crispata]
MALEAPITKKRRLASGADGVNAKGETITKAKEKRGGSMCVGCGSQIVDQYIMQVSPDLSWHASCLKCADCEQYLDESCTCFVRDGKTYCKRDYVRLFGTKCSRCGVGFCREDVVMRPTKSTVYHLNCFRCVVCNKPLVTGDEFAIRDDGLFCRADHDVMDRSVTTSPCQDIGSPGSATGSTKAEIFGDARTLRSLNKASHCHSLLITTGSRGRASHCRCLGVQDQSHAMIHAKTLSIFSRSIIGDLGKSAPGV